MGRIFVSYRREDSEADAGRLYQSLRDEFGAASVYKDVDNVPLGSDWRAAIHEAIEQSDAMVVVIGPEFVGSATRPRLERGNDPVRIEIEAANAAGVTIIPVLVRGAAMPAVDSLPESLEWLSYRNAADLRHASWDRDLEPVIEALEGYLRNTEEGSTAAGPVSSPPDLPTSGPGSRRTAQPAEHRRDEPAAPDDQEVEARGKNRVPAAPDSSPHSEVIFRHHWLPVTAAGSMVTLFAWAIIIGLFVGADAASALTVLLIWAVSAAALVLGWLFTTYELTDAALVIRKGTLTRSRVDVPYDQVTDTKVVQGFLARKLGYGYVLIKQRGRLTPRKLGSVQNVGAFQSQLSEVTRRLQR